MRLAARFIATMTVAFFLVPTLFADDAVRPADTPKADESVSSTANPGGSRVPHPAGKTLLPVLGFASRQAAAGQGSGTRAGRRGRQSGQSGATTPKVELFMGYSYWRAVPESTGNRIDAMHGGSASLAYNLNSHFGLVFDFAGFRADSLLFNSPGAGFTPTRVVDVNGDVFTFLFGPRVSFRNHGRLTPFLQVLAGAARASEVRVDGCNFPIYSCTPLPEETAFALTAGGGLDYRLNRRIALRLIQVEYFPTHFQDPTSLGGDKGWQSNVRLSAGIVFRFGGNPPPPPPNHSPIVSCSAEPDMIYAGSGEMPALHAVASDPDNDPLTYSWETSTGTVEGTGPDARWNSSGAAEGTYPVNVRVDDGRGGTATCSANIRVEAKPNNAPTVTCSADRSSVFAGERIHITTNANDPDGDRLTYVWRANAGRVAGTDAAADFDTTGLAPGMYTVTVRVDDARGGAADCSTTVEVKAPPAAPMASKINECTFGKPLSTRIDNVCKRILDDVALRLQSEPRASVVIIGYSDPGERNPAVIAADRGANAVKYLGEKGIDPSRATTRTGSGEAGDNIQNRRIDVIWVPEGATY
ncbi:MAG TPA: PKD domain-containing protein [Candidatus Dormibacteraeota bacterium]|nr:PKD domain-containing protein [Candidatus Dormibacteraeota bacterium]